MVFICFEGGEDSRAQPSPRVFLCIVSVVVVAYSLQLVEAPRDGGKSLGGGGVGRGEVPGAGDPVSPVCVVRLFRFFFGKLSYQ